MARTCLPWRAIGGGSVSEVVAVSFAASTRGGILLIAFYQTGSTLTKLKATEKAKLDASSDDAHGSRHVVSFGLT